jgi:hypothetical protein
MFSSTVLDPYPIIKEAGIIEHATSNAARLHCDTACEYMYRGVTNVFAPESTGHDG